MQLDDVVNFVGSIREAVGPRYDLALECHARYDVETAIQLCHLLEPFRLIWVEEPIPSDDVDAMVRVRNATRVPIAAGENIYSRYGYRPFLEKEALSVIQPDVSKTGGLLKRARSPPWPRFIRSQSRPMVLLLLWARWRRPMSPPRHRT